MAALHVFALCHVARVRWPQDDMYAKLDASLNEVPGEVRAVAVADEDDWILRADIWKARFSC